MRQLDDLFHNRYESIYRPLVERFFTKLDALNLTEKELEAIPELFIPSCGNLYPNSLIRIAIVGKETYGWGSSLFDALQRFKQGKYELTTSEYYFRSEGPVEWRNQFWQYAAMALGSLYKLDKSVVLTKKSPIIRTIAWCNIHAIETYESQGVSDDIPPQKMTEIQNIAFECGLTDIDNFIEVFKPHVIIQMYRKESDYDSKRWIEKAEYFHNWGEGGFLNEYSYRNTIILHCWHSRYLQQYAGISEETFAHAVRDALTSHKLFKRLISLPHYDELGDYSHFCELANEMAASSDTTSDQDLAQEVVTAIAMELRKTKSTMTARLLTSVILNQIPRFREHGWQYSPNGRGPCRVVRGVWNVLDRQGRKEEAEFVADAFTGIHGNLCWE